MAAKRHKNRKNKITGLVNSMCYNEQKSKFRIFTHPSSFHSRRFYNPLPFRKRSEIYLFTAKAQRTQRFNYFLFSGERSENKKNQLYWVNLIAKATIFVTYLKLKLFSEKVLFYSLPSFLSAGGFGGSTAKNKKKRLCVLCVSAVKTI